MPQPHLRTRSRRRLSVALPSGESRIHFKTENTSAPPCFSCGQPLAGVPHLSPVKMHKLNRSKRRIWRPYGGQLCHNCLKNALKHAARIL